MECTYSVKRPVFTNFYDPLLYFYYIQSRHTHYRSKWSKVHDGVAKVFSKTFADILKEVTLCESKPSGHHVPHSLTNHGSIS
jgi:hypothetical protein